MLKHKKKRPRIGSKPITTQGSCVNVRVLYPGGKKTKSDIAQDDIFGKKK